MQDGISNNLMKFSHHRSIGQSAREYCRGIAGGLVFSLPLLYTMEVWWAGGSLHPGRVLLYVAGTFCLLLLYNRFAGLREDAGFGEVVIDSVEEMGLGLVIAAGVLWLTGQVDVDSSPAEVVGKVVMEAMTVAIGVSVGTAQLGGEAEGDDGVCGEESGEPGAGSDQKGYLPQAALGLCGAVLFAANLAPTEEIRQIASQSTPFRLFLLMVGSLLAAAAVLHFSEMHGVSRWVSRDTVFQRIRGVVTSYAMGLAAAAGCLYVFGNLDQQPGPLKLSMIVIAGFPAVLGASAGRLLLQSGSGHSGGSSSASS